MTERALTFGAVAAAYEEFRPGYPDEVVERVLAYAERPVRRALEIGAGTGKATRVFAAAGIAVTATDPDEAMLAELAKHVPESVTVVRGRFEDLEPTTPYDLVYAAASLHWTRPEGRWERVAALLGPGGTFACFGGERRLADPSLDAAVRAARAPFLADDEVPTPDGAPRHGSVSWPASELSSEPLFTDVRQVVIARPRSLPATAFVGHLSTVSAYLELPEAVRAVVLDRILGVLPEVVDVDADLTLHLARRV